MVKTAEKKVLKDVKLVSFAHEVKTGFGITTLLLITQLLSFIIDLKDWIIFEQI